MEDTSTSLSMSRSRSPPFSTDEFGDLVSSALNSNSFTEQSLSFHPELESRSILQPVQPTIFTHSNNSTSDLSFAENVCSPASPTAIFKSIKRRASALVMRSKPAVTPSEVPPVPRLAMPSLTPASASFWDDEEDEDEDFTPYLPIAARLERASMRTTVPTSTEPPPIHSPSRSIPPSPCSPAFSISSASTSDPYSPLTPNTPNYSHSHSHTVESGSSDYRWSILTEEDDLSSSDDPFAKGSVQVVQYHQYSPSPSCSNLSRTPSRSSSSTHRNKGKKHRPPPILPPPSCPLPTPPSSDDDEHLHYRNRDCRDWTLRLGIPSLPGIQGQEQQNINVRRKRTVRPHPKSLQNQYQHRDQEPDWTLSLPLPPLPLISESDRELPSSYPSSWYSTPPLTRTRSSHTIPKSHMTYPLTLSPSLPSPRKTKVWFTGCESSRASTSNLKPKITRRSSLTCLPIATTTAPAPGLGLAPPPRPQRSPLRLQHQLRREATRKRESEMDRVFGDFLMRAGATRNRAREAGSWVDLEEEQEDGDGERDGDRDSRLSLTPTPPSPGTTTSDGDGSVVFYSARSSFSVASLGV